MQEQAGRAKPGPDGRQVVEVTIRGGYFPARIVARPGVPIRIAFRREDDDRCTERVVFSAPRLERHLASAGTTIVDLPAQPAGEVRFTCGMGRYRGRIELVEEGGRHLPARLDPGQLRAPLARALALWIGSLPIVAVLVVLGLQPEEALAMAIGVLVAWVTACLWATRLRRTPHQT